MLRRFALSVALLVSFAAIGAAQSVEDIVAKTIAAQGGADKIKAIQTMRMSGTMTLGPTMEAPVTIEAKRPRKLRVDFDIQGTTNSQGYDGETGWSFYPVQGMKVAQAATPEELKNLDEQADMDGPLVDYKAKGNTIELAGKEAVQGADAYKLKITLKAGEVRYVYIDAQTFLPVKSEAKRMIGGAERLSSTVVSDYKPVAGVMTPHSIETTVEGVPLSQKVVIQKIEVNIPIDDSRFKMPVAKSPDK